MKLEMEGKWDDQATRGDGMGGRVNDRYEVSHTLEGGIACAATRVEAFAIAEKWVASDTGYDDAALDVHVYDAMARIGQPEEWEMTDAGWRVIGLRVK